MLGSTIYTTSSRFLEGPMLYKSPSGETGCATPWHAMAQNGNGHICSCALPWFFRKKNRSSHKSQRWPCDEEPIRIYLFDVSRCMKIENCQRRSSKVLSIKPGRSTSSSDEKTILSSWSPLTVGYFCLIPCAHQIPPQSSPFCPPVLCLYVRISPILCFIQTFFFPLSLLF